MSERVREAPRPCVSVVVPVFNDMERLKLCLAALRGQTYPSDRFEVVVIDNGSSENVAQACAEAGSLRVLSEGKPGSYAARNRGIAAVRSEVVAFTDSDCIPLPDWIEKGVARLLVTPGCGIVGGRIELFFGDQAHPNLAEAMDKHIHLKQQEYVEKHKFAATANVFTYKHVIDHVGVFREDIRSLGDFDWGRRVFKAGYSVIYAPEVVIRHPARRSVLALVDKERRREGGIFAMSGISRQPWRTKLRYLSAGWLRPLIRSPWRAAQGERDGLLQKLSFVALFLVLQYAGRFERIRLIFGSEAQR